MEEDPKQSSIANSAQKYRNPIPRTITPTTANPPSRAHALKYPDKAEYAKSLNHELYKIDEQGTTTWLQLGELELLAKKTKELNLTRSF